MTLTHHILLTGLWVISAIFDYAEVTYNWQLKEYRLDRIIYFIKSKQGQATLMHYRYVWRALLALLLFVLFQTHNDSILWILYVVLGLDVIFNIKLVLKRKLRRPTITKKVGLILLVTIAAEIALAWVFHTFHELLLILVLRSIIISASIVLVDIPTTILKKTIIWYASIKMKRYKDLKVVGITGSYGKTTVKEFLSHILSEKYKVIKTPKNINTDIGVAKFILKTDFSKYDMFVVEMGAYCIGEIKKLTDIVHPTVGILTAINEQHLSLFGSIKNTQQAKYELLRAIPKDGFITTNSDNKYCRELLDTLECENIKTFGTEEEFNPQCLIEDISSTKDGITCSGKYNGQPAELSAPVIGKHQALNIAASAIVAMHLGMNFNELEKAVQTLKNGTDNALKTYNYGESVIIDDSYNSNPDGFKAALEIMTSYSSKYKRVVITRGMVELGPRSHELHMEIGEEIAFVADDLVIITPDAADSLLQGVSHLKNKFNLETHQIYEHDKLLAFVKKYKKEKVIILLENRIPALVHTELKQS